jgi:hypothetical protein
MYKVLRGTYSLYHQGRGMNKLHMQDTVDIEAGWTRNQWGVEGINAEK